MGPARQPLNFVIEALLSQIWATTRDRGAQFVGEVVQYEDAYRLCYVRGPEGFSSDSPKNSAERRHHNAILPHFG